MKFIFMLTLFFNSFIFANNSDFLHVKKTDRILAIGPGALRLVTIMDLEHKLIGIEKTEHKNIAFSEYRSIIGKKRITSLPIIGSGGPGKLPNLEKLISLKPDVIIASFVDKKQLNLIKTKTNIPIVSLSYGLGYGGEEQKLEAVKNSLLLLGKIFKKEQRAAKIVAFMNAQEEAFKTYKINSENLYIGGIGFKGAHGITSTEKYYPPFVLLNIKNTLTKNAKSNHVFIQEESLITQNPEIIFLDMYGKKIIQEAINSKPALYKALKAYKNKKIFWLYAYNFYNTNIANVYINAWIILSKLGYDINIKEKMTQIYDTFYKNGANKLMPTRYPIMSFQ